MEIKTLILKCQEGDVAAQKWLLHQLNGMTYSVCRRYAKNEYETRDIRTDAFMKIITSLPKFTYRNDGAFMAWVKKILINTCIDQGAESTSYLETLDELPEDGLVDMGGYACIEIKDITLALSRLPSGYRRIFNLFEIDGYSHKEIAEMLDIEEVSSRSQLSRAKNMLQRMLKPKIEQHGNNRE